MGRQKSLKWNKEFNEMAMHVSGMERAAKFIATIDSKGRSRITLIVLNRAKTPNQVVWGQFSQGTSKKNVYKNPKVGVLYMTAEYPYVFVQAKADFDHAEIGGEDCEYFSRLSLLRYNTYVNAFCAYYANVKKVSPVQSISLLKIIQGIMTNLIGKNGAKSKNPVNKLPEFGFTLFNNLIAPKYISYIDSDDGYPVIVPCFHVRAPDRSKLVFPLTQLKELLLNIPEGDVCVFGLDFDYQTMMVYGTFNGFQRFRGIKYGIIEIDEVWNSMPPLTGMIYPTLQFREKVTDFHL